MVSIVMAGGGTAGHTSPLIATAERLRDLEPDARLLAVGTAKGLETTVIPAAGLELALIPPVPLPRRLTPELLAVPGRLVGAVSRARRILRDRQADVAVGFGGYVSLPVYLAARTLGIPIAIHEQNALPGLANKIAARFASLVGVSFPDTPLPGARYLGLPVRRGIAHLDRTASREATRAGFGITGGGPVLLVSGGSQGARSLNLALAGALDRLLQAGINVVHVLGPKNITDEVAREHESGARYLPLAYVEKMEDAYAVADLMVGRSGAGTVMETATVGLPTIFVPLPHGNGEQARNATFLVDGGAARLVADADFSSERLLSEVLPLIGDAEALAAMTRASRDLVPGDAAGRLAGLIVGLTRSES